MSQFSCYYGELAKLEVDETVQNGRYLIQKDAEKSIPEDVQSKLLATAEDSFLDIGCGIGLNLKKISQIVCDSTCCDNPHVIERLKKSFSQVDNISFFSGDFLDIDFPKKYSKIIIYCVIPALPNLETVHAFVNKAIGLLELNGRLLLGDIANVDRKKRFLSSHRGLAFQKQWEEQMSQISTEEDFVPEQDYETVLIGDKEILGICDIARSRGYDAFILPQPHDLPFGQTREDILIVGPENEQF
ncbi:methyltransferase domain-containing protein [Kiloniella majae]|uniref:methyltransferase domain-containing protein n=1 Tax=Kiloniella majae TaxID=1938558 RepID=UPI000A277236|nr:class I SAM-dependent methyltransferase [Kiloniella majae]